MAFFAKIKAVLGPNGEKEEFIKVVIILYWVSNKKFPSRITAVMSIVGRVSREDMERHSGGS